MNHKTIFIAVVLMSLAAAFTACETTPEPPALQPPTLISPADGSMPAQNPPTFVWSTVNEEQIVYRLDVASDEAFTDTCLCISVMIVPPDTQFLPDSAFAPGLYYWRMCTRQDC